MVRCRPYVEKQQSVEDRRQVGSSRAPVQRASPLRAPILRQMPHVGDLANGILAVLGNIVVGKGMVACDVPACRKLGGSNTGPTRQPRHPLVRTRRAEYLGAPGEVRRILLGVVEVVMVIVKILLVTF